MTSAGPPFPVPEDDALDAASSAVVDGVATPEEEAAVGAAPDGAARVAILRAVADAVGAPVGAQDPAAAAGALAAAMAAFDAAAGADESEGNAPARAAGRSDGASVAGVPTRPPAPGPSRGFPRLAAVAAALLLLVGIGAFSVAALQSDEDGATTFTAAAPAQDAAGTVGTSEAADPGARAAGPGVAGPGVAGPGVAGPGVAGPGGAAPSSVPPSAPVPGVANAAPSSLPPVVDGGDLGRQDDVAAVGARAAAALAGEPQPSVAGPGAALPSDVQTCAAAASSTGEPLGPLRYRAVGTFRGTPAVFVAYDRPGASPPRLLLIVARSGCAVLASTPF